MFKKFVSAWIVCILALFTTIMLVPPAQGATVRTIVVAYEDAGFNNPCLIPTYLGGCKSSNLEWSLGNCVTQYSPGYRWTLSNRLAPEHYSQKVRYTMSSVKLSPGSGCNYLSVRAGNGSNYGQCVVNSGGGIGWFGPGYNDDVIEVGAYYYPSCGRHM